MSIYEASEMGMGKLSVRTFDLETLTVTFVLAKCISLYLKQFKLVITSSVSKESPMM